MEPPTETYKEEDVFEEPVPKKEKGPMDPKTRARLLDNLRRGRETSARKRKEKAEARRIKKSMAEADVQHFLRMKQDAVSASSFNPDTIMSKLAEIENKISTFSARKPEPAQEPKVEVKPKPKVLPQPKPEPKPEPKPYIPEPIPPALQMYTTFNSLPW
tara:strand:+ start:107 stop:583 length:477 start_codon:yes stop_codon:yes gene_type:complete